MRIASYSDIHLEFETPLPVIDAVEADLLVLSGDITTLPMISRLGEMLQNWQKPVLYVLGNHEYYHRNKTMNEVLQGFQEYCQQTLPNLTILDNQAIEIDGVHFFGGTMWTDFDNGNALQMIEAHQKLNDFRTIHYREQRRLTPDDTRALHRHFREALAHWMDAPLTGPRVVISHHCPAYNPATLYKGSSLQGAFVARTMEEVILNQGPDLWFYGHTHEIDDRIIGPTRLISNQRGYRQEVSYECSAFDSCGMVVTV